MIYTKRINELLRKGMIFSAIFFLTLVLSCKEEGELIPEFNTSGIGVSSDSLFVTSSTVYGDTVRTDRVSRMLLGKLYDETFGLSTAEYCTQFYLSTGAFDLPDEVTELDSLILNLTFDDFYGFYDENDVFGSGQKVDIYELSEDLISDQEYYSNSKVEYKTEPIGTARLLINNNDREFDDLGDERVLRIRINEEVKDRIFTENEFSNNAA